MFVVVKRVYKFKIFFFFCLQKRTSMEVDKILRKVLVYVLLPCYFEKSSMNFPYYYRISLSLFNIINIILGYEFIEWSRIMTMIKDFFKIDWHTQVMAQFPCLVGSVDLSVLCTFVKCLVCSHKSWRLLGRFYTTFTMF